MDTFVKKTLKVSTIKNVSTLSKTDGLIRCATYNMAGNGKAPDSRTGIVLKSGAKVLRYF